MNSRNFVSLVLAIGVWVMSFMLFANLQFSKPTKPDTVEMDLAMFTAYLEQPKVAKLPVEAPKDIQPEKAKPAEVKTKQLSFDAPEPENKPEESLKEKTAVTEMAKPVVAASAIAAVATIPTKKKEQPITKKKQKSPAKKKTKVTKKAPKKKVPKKKTTRKQTKKKLKKKSRKKKTTTKPKKKKKKPTKVTKKESQNSLKWTTSSSKSTGVKKAATSPQKKNTEPVKSAKKVAPKKASGSEISAYKSGLQSAIRRKVKRQRLKGRVVVKFNISASGAISNVRVSKSSGKASLDRSAMSAVRRVGRYKSRPLGMGATVSIPITFN